MFLVYLLWYVFVRGYVYVMYIMRKRFLVIVSTWEVDHNNNKKTSFE